MNRFFAPLIGLLLVIIAVSFVFIRIYELRVPFSPGKDAVNWELELVVSALSEGGYPRLSLALPSTRNPFQVQNSSFTSDGYALTFLKDAATNTVDFTKKNAEPEKQEFVYHFNLKRNYQRGKYDLRDLPQLSFSPEEIGALKKYQQKLISSNPKLEDVKYFVPAFLKNYKKELSFIRSKRVAAGALSYLGVDGKIFYGILLERKSINSKFTSFYFFLDKGKAKLFSFKKRKLVPRSKAYLWGENYSPVEASKGLQELSWELSAMPRQAYATADKQKISSRIGRALYWFSFERLNLETRIVFSVLLLLPLAALIVAVIRNVVGLKTFGTFMPALIALSFRETGFFWGMVLFLLVLLLGVVLRYVFRYLHLLIVPRLTASLTIVVIVLYYLSLLFVDWKGLPISSVSIFPVVVITMIIERFTVTIEELGIKASLWQLLNSTIAAFCSYIVITNKAVSYAIVSFPELNLAVLGAAVLLGRYFGYRLMELTRFSSFAATKNKK